jgi:hypothetical protein
MLLPKKEHVKRGAMMKSMTIIKKREGAISEKKKTFNDVGTNSDKEMCSTKLNDDISKRKKLVSRVQNTC